MALLFEGMACPLCHKPMLREQNLFGTWGVWLPPANRLRRFCDAMFHWECYADWEERAPFARSYFDFCVELERTDPYWTCVFLNDELFVAVNPHDSIRAAWVHLAETGSRFSVGLPDWERWLNEDPGAGLHPVEAQSLREAKAILAARVPTVDVLLQHADFDRKLPLLERLAEEQKQRAAQKVEEARDIERHNEQCERTMQRIREEGLRCGNCGQDSSEYRLSVRSGCRSLIICRRCGWVVD